MLYTLDMIKEANKERPSTIEEKEIINFSEDYSFFCEVLEGLTIENILFNKMIYENNNEEIVEEGTISKFIWNKLKSVDIKKILLKILEGFGKLLKSLWDHFKAFMIQFSSKNSTFKKYDKELSNYDKDLIYQDKRCIFTNLDGFTSYNSFRSEIRDARDSLLRDGEEILSAKDPNKLAQILNNMKQERNNLVIDADMIRGNALGLGSPISKDDFGKYLYNHFRGEIIDGGTMTGMQVQDAYRSWKNIDKDVDLVKQDMTKLRNDCSKEEQAIKGMRLEDRFKGEITEEAASEFMRLVTYSVQYTKETCQTFLQILGSKMDAIKERGIQNTAICTAAVREIVRTGGAES